MYYVVDEAGNKVGGAPVAGADGKVKVECLEPSGNYCIVPVDDGKPSVKIIRYLGL